MTSCSRLPVVRADLEKRRDRVLRELHPTLRARVISLLEYMGGRVTPYCGYRDAEAQAKAFAEGRSGARFGQSPHNFKPALACDVVLDPDRVNVAPVKGAEEWPNLWDVESPDAVAAWADLEKAAIRFHLERVNVDGERDRPHLQLPAWRIYVVR